MSVHASENLANVEHSLYVVLKTMTIPGVVDFQTEGDGVVPATSAGPVPYIRFSLVPGASKFAGRFDSAHSATIEAVEIRADVHWPSGLRSTLDLHAAVAAVKSFVERRAFPFLDYVSDNVSPPTLPAHLMRPWHPPQVRELPPLRGFLRRRVSVSVQRTAAHAI